MKNLNFLGLIFSLLAAHSASAYTDGTVSIGIGYYSQNFFGEVTKSADGENGLSGTTSLPLIARYEWNFMSDLYLSPAFSFTPIARKAEGGSSEISLIQFVLPVGGVIFESIESSMDWAVGVGVTQYSIKGKGGIKTLSNGTGTASFAAPGRTVSARTATFNLGTAYNYSAHRFGLDLVFEGLLSKKRTQSLMLSYSYRFGGN